MQNANAVQSDNELSPHCSQEDVVMGIFPIILRIMSNIIRMIREVPGEILKEPVLYRQTRTFLSKTLHIEIQTCV